MLCILNIPFLYYFKTFYLVGTRKKTLIEIKTLTLITVFALMNTNKLNREK